MHHNDLLTKLSIQKLSEINICNLTVLEIIPLLESFPKKKLVELIANHILHFVDNENIRNEDKIFLLLVNFKHRNSHPNDTITLFLYLSNVVQDKQIVIDNFTKFKKLLYDENVDIYPIVKMLNKACVLAKNKKFEFLPHGVIKELMIDLIVNFYKSEILEGWHSKLKSRYLFDKLQNYCYPHLDFLDHNQLDSIYNRINEKLFDPIVINYHSDSREEFITFLKDDYAQYCKNKIIDYSNIASFLFLAKKNSCKLKNIPKDILCNIAEEVADFPSATIKRRVL